MTGAQTVRRLATTALMAVVVGCGPTPPSPSPQASVIAATIPSAEPTPAQTPSPVATTSPRSTPSPSPSAQPDPATVPLVPVVGFWSGTTGISSAELRAALAGTGRYRTVLVAGVMPGATTSTPAAIRAAVNRDGATLGLLPAGDVTADVHALALDGRDLFGNERLRDLAGWPLLVPTRQGDVVPPRFDPVATWTLVAGGDVMLDRSVYQRTVRAGKGADYPWDGGLADITGRTCCTTAGGKLPVARRAGGSGAVRALFKNADLAVVNLEGPAVDDFRWHPHGLTFTFDPALLAGLRDAGIDVATVANNHIGNAGPDGVTETVRHLDEFDIAHVGAGRDAGTAHRPAWFDVAGQRIALLGYDAIRPAYHATGSRPGSAGLVAADYRADLQAARAAGADVTVVLPHWGVEYTSTPTASQRANARNLAAAGATLVLGSHSHWAGAMETVDGTPVVYSLGNLVFDLARSEETVEGLIVEITFAGARPVQIRLHPTVVLDLAQPNLLDPQGDGAPLIQRMRRASAALSGD